MKWLQIAILAVLVTGPGRQFAAAQTKVVKVKEVPVSAITSVDGGALYTHYCSVCHGVEGKGNGPAAVALKNTPTDLTQIARKNGGKYPVLAVQQAIKNTDGIAAHGIPGMPVWGVLLVSSADDRARGVLRINNLTSYIEGLQR
jgi:mono/diheme cytochrome c family protein